VTGTELIRRKSGGEAYAVTTPLIKKADGTKFGKTEGGSVWLDTERTSPYEFYQFWLNSSDADSVNYIRIFTLRSKEQIEELEKVIPAAVAQKLKDRIEEKSKSDHKPKRRDQRKQTLWQKEKVPATADIHLTIDGTPIKDKFLILINGRKVILPAKSFNYLLQLAMVFEQY
jgi:tyrosyl-tRNA synthetase